MKNTLLMILTALGIACSDSGTLPTEAPEVGVNAEPLNGACTGGVTKEKARLNCQNWRDDGATVSGFNCPQVGFLGLKSFKLQAGAPAGKNWYKVTWHDTPGGANRTRFDQCSCNDANPCTAISALAEPKEPEESLQGAAGSAAPNTYATTVCSTSDTARGRTLIQAAVHWSDLDFYKCTNEHFDSVPVGANYLNWQCGEKGSATAKERIVRKQDLWNGYCVWELQKLPYKASAWVSYGKAECDPSNATNQATCFYTNY